MLGDSIYRVAAYISYVHTSYVSYSPALLPSVSAPEASFVGLYTLYNARTYTSSRDILCVCVYVCVWCRKGQVIVSMYVCMYILFMRYRMYMYVYCCGIDVVVYWEWKMIVEQYHCIHTHTYTHTHILTCMESGRPGARIDTATTHTHLHIRTHTHTHIYIHTHILTCMESGRPGARIDTITTHCSVAGCQAPSEGNLC